MLRTWLEDVVDGLLLALVGWPEAEVTAWFGLAAVVGTAEGDGLVEMVLAFFLGGIVRVGFVGVSLLFLFLFLDVWVVVLVRGSFGFIVALVHSIVVLVRFGPSTSSRWLFRCWRWGKREPEP